MALSKQDEKMRIRRRLQEKAIELAALNRWQEAADLNQQLLRVGEDVETYNRLGKALFELGKYADSHRAYQNALRLNAANPIARKNVARLEALLARGITEAPITRSTRQQVDMRMFITETGRTALTSLVDVQRGPAVDALITGEKVELRVEGKMVYVVDLDGNLIGRIEPKLSHRLVELINGGNRYLAAVVQSDSRNVRILIREVYQDPSQRGRVSFPGKLGEGATILSSLRFDDYEDVLDEEELVEEPETFDDDFVGSDDEEEIGLDEIDQDIGDDDDNLEE
ncbi:MAG TPA: tetratricopeptide repeat protein [Chloroflexus aurantiacus]|jgi:tetratricopeptide (TPR) repeat protein|uniref:Tetratricopeptide TPR_2 repeat protein n=1 Tax=Chloroflexus aurantiacus (strain ATCC 29366 / DSM 635 / J-10-fl) TaxID=324602 RepID=A9WHB0_CHLAA|nr:MULTISPECIES: tetratricopeptide repeat protein [Chloroflexus]ABY35622.1 Tetratricopeptide TPR_2 repeat protein [Chloroflexus aurantiacus J-10-fl]RMG48028.1 MAG: tetratricopeptide repeat protein [Chloroflexota bacterium]HBW67962.1 tetratricopeptide repeat protein [Chloroflexus aurantiacus]